MVSAANYKTGETIIIDSVLEKDTYIACKHLTTKAPVRAELIAAAQTISIEDSVLEDAELFGRTISIYGFCNDDLRAFCRKLTLSSTVKGDVLVFAKNTVIAKSSIIEGDLILFSGEVKLNGTVNGNVIIYGGTVTINGSVKGSLKIKAHRATINQVIGGTSSIAASSIELGKNAVFKSPSTYWQKAGELQTSNPNLSYDQSLQENKMNLKYLVWGGLGFFIWNLLFGLLLIAILNSFFERKFFLAANAVLNNPLKSFGYGVLYFILTPIVCLLLILTIIGIPIGFILLGIFIFSVFSGLAIASLVYAWLFKNKYKKRWGSWSIAGIAVVILAIFQLVLLLPLLGFLITVILVPIAFGGLLRSRKMQ